MVRAQFHIVVSSVTILIFLTLFMWAPFNFGYAKNFVEWCDKKKSFILQYIDQTISNERSLHCLVRVSVAALWNCHIRLDSTTFEWWSMWVHFVYAASIRHRTQFVLCNNERIQFLSRVLIRWQTMTTYNDYDKLTHNMNPHHDNNDSQYHFIWCTYALYWNKKKSDAATVLRACRLTFEDFSQCHVYANDAS